LPAPNTVKVDITISEKIVLPLENGTVLQSYAEFSDVAANREVRVYSLGEILTEKIVALSDRARTEPRDLYDAWHLANDGIAISDLTHGIEAQPISQRCPSSFFAPTPFHWPRQFSDLAENPQGHIVQ
jgi:hypothetical protein